MHKRLADIGCYTQGDFIRIGFIAGVWLAFYGLMLAQVTHGPSRMSRAAMMSAPDWHAAAADFARLPHPPAPVRDAFAP